MVKSTRFCVSSWTQKKSKTFCLPARFYLFYYYQYVKDHNENKKQPSLKHKYSWCKKKIDMLVKS